MQVVNLESILNFYEKILENDVKQVNEYHPALMNIRATFNGKENSDLIKIMQKNKL
jgi:hypothetical protein